MSISIAEKLALIRESERANKKEFAELIGVNYGSYVHYENGRNIPSVEVVMKMLSHPQLEKYTLWFITGRVSPESGQIAPVLAHSGPSETTYSASGQKTG